jgi:imidazolonepropionase-like amidohydrolase
MKSVKSVSKNNIVVASKETYLAGWMIDGSGRPPEKNVLMTVAGGEIRSLGKTAMPVPGIEGGVNVADCTILPGLIDAHVHLFMGRDNLVQMAEQQIIWVPTAVTMQAYIKYMEHKEGRGSGCATLLQPGKDDLHPAEGARRNLDHQLEQIAIARQLGVPVAAGTDAGSPGVDHGKSLQEEISLLIQAGYSIPEAVRCATRINAKLLGLDNGGRLAVGMPATFVAIKGPPEDLPHSLGRIISVIVNGKQYA